MVKRYFEKLIRDRVPEIMATKGVVFDVYTLDQAAFREALLKKVGEEAAELMAAKTPSEMMAELGDLLDVLDAVRREFAIAGEALALTRKAQMEKKGGFAKRLFLRWSEDPE